MRIPFHLAILVSALAVAKPADADDAVECTRDALSLSHFGRDFDACHRVAKEGSPLAEYVLGEMYNRGLGVPRDYSEGSVWLRRAADQGFAPAQTALGYNSSKVKVCPSTTPRLLSGIARPLNRDMRKLSTNSGFNIPKVGVFLRTMYWHTCG
jgi:TPR repeat protein